MKVNQTGKSVLVTGAAGGIGSVIVRALNGAGWKVIGTDHPSMQPDSQTRNSCIEWVPVNLIDIVKDSRQLDTFVGAIHSAQESNPLYGIVHNAALQKKGPFKELTQNDWTDTLSVNLIAPVIINKALLTLLINQHGAIVNISSIHSCLTKPDFTAYATSKAALSGLARAMAVELGERIRVNTIEPAAISTPMLEAGFADNPDLKFKLKEFHPTGSIGEPTDVSRAVLFLLDPSNSFVNGSILNVSGGIHSRLHDPS